jgi:ribulose-phosphate 3-epimerase
MTTTAALASVLAQARPGRLIVEASLWSADPRRLHHDLARVAALADLLHVDASDGRFAPAPQFTPAALSRLPAVGRPVHVHLMAARPLEQIAAWVQAGADLITVHAEAEHAEEALRSLRDLNVGCGLAVRLDSDPSVVQHFADLIDVVIMIGTPLGTKGTSMAPQAPRRLAEVRALLDAHHSATSIHSIDDGAAGNTDDGAARWVPIIADGGIRPDTVPSLTLAGAAGVVAGSMLFTSPDPAGTLAWLRSPAGEAP